MMFFTLTGGGLVALIFCTIAALLIAWSLYHTERLIVGFVIHGLAIFLGIAIISSLWTLPFAPAAAIWLVPLSVMIVILLLIPLDDALHTPSEESDAPSQGNSPSLHD